MYETPNNIELFYIACRYSDIATLFEYDIAFYINKFMPKPAHACTYRHYHESTAAYNLKEIISPNWV